MKVLKNKNTIYSLENFRTIEMITKTSEKEIVYHFIKITYADNKETYIECGVGKIGSEMAQILIDKIYNILT